MTPGITAFVWSWTTPRTLLLLDCGQIGMTTKVRIAIATPKYKYGWRRISTLPDLARSILGQNNPFWPPVSKVQPDLSTTNDISPPRRQAQPRWNRDGGGCVAEVSGLRGYLVRRGECVVSVAVHPIHPGLRLCNK